MSTTWLLRFLFVGGLVPGALGFIFDLHDFIAHVLAGVAGLVLGAVLAVWLIDWMLRQRRREQWSLVLAELQRAACECVLDMAAEFATALPSGSLLTGLPKREDDPLAHREVAEILHDFASEAEADVEWAASHEDPRTSSTRSLYQEVDTILTPLRKATATGMMALADNPELVSLLLLLERRERRWGAQMDAAERIGSPDQLAWAAAIKTLQAGAKIYGYFADQSS